MPSRIIGIDLGTTNSVVAVMEAGEPAVIVNLEGARIQSLIEQTNDAVIILDDGLDILFWNRSAEVLYGHAKEQVIGKQISVFPDIASIKKTLKRIKEGKKAVRFETGAVHYDGHNLAVDVTIDGIKDDKDALIGYSLISADITDAQ